MAGLLDVLTNIWLVFLSYSSEGYDIANPFLSCYLLTIQWLANLNLKQCW